MLIKYNCTNPNCAEVRYFSSVQTELPLCKKCGSNMTDKKTNIVVEVMTTPESRFMGDEALFNTVGDRVSKKHRVRHT